MKNPHALTPEEEAKATQYCNQWNQTKKSIPEKDYNNIKTIADGVTTPIWGRGIEPDHVVWMHRSGIDNPQKIHQFFSEQPHPHAPNVKLGEYADYVHAYREWKKYSNG